MLVYVFLFLQSGMALTYDPTAMQNGYVESFFFFYLSHEQPRSKECLQAWLFTYIVTPSLFKSDSIKSS